jgi:acetyl-CoA acetyltransferase
MVDSIRYKVAVVGASETTEIGRQPGMSSLMLAADAAMNAIKDCGIDKDQIDGVLSTHNPNQLAHYLGIKTPRYVDGTAVGGTSFVIHLRHAVAALNAGYCNYALIAMGESGYSRADNTGIRQGTPIPGPGRPNDLGAQFEAPYGVFGPTTQFGMGVLRYMKETGTTHDQLASVAVAQRKWSNKVPRAMMRDLITIDDVYNSRMICYPFHLLECCLVTDAGGAIILTTADRAKDFPTKPVYVLGTGETVETPMISQMIDFTSSAGYKVASKKAMDEAQITHKDVDHIMIYDAFAHLPIYALEDTGFVPRGQAGAFIAEGRTSPGGELPLNTNGGGLSYTHSGMYGMYLLQEAIRQQRGTAAHQVDGVKVSFVQGIGGMFGAMGSCVFSNEPPF